MTKGVENMGIYTKENGVDVRAFLEEFMSVLAKDNKVNNAVAFAQTDSGVRVSVCGNFGGHFGENTADAMICLLQDDLKHASAKAFLSRAIDNSARKDGGKGQVADALLVALLSAISKEA